MPTVGLDGDALLDALDAEDAPAWWRDLPAVKALRYIWRQQYYRGPEGIRWRTAVDGLPPSPRMISSPHDLEARYAQQYTTSWIGYTVYCTERCEGDEPHLSTHVETTAGPVADGTVMPAIHEALRAKPLLPRRHLVDPGSLDADLLVATPRDYGVELLGPTRPVDHWRHGRDAALMPATVASIGHSGGPGVRWGNSAVVGPRSSTAVTMPS